MQDFHQELFNIDERLNRSVSSIEEHNMLYNTLLRGVKTESTLAGYLMVLLEYQSQHSELFRTISIDEISMILNLARGFLMKESRKIRKDKANDGWHIPINTFCSFANRYLSSNHPLRLYSEAIVEALHPSRHYTRPLKDFFCRLPIAFINELTKDKFLLLEEKLEILSYLHIKRGQIFEQLIVQRKDIESEELLDNYLIQKSQQLIIKNDLFEAIRLLTTIQKESSHYHTARYAISLHLRTLLNDKRLMLSSGSNQDSDSLVMKCAASVVNDEFPQDAIESNYREAVLCTASSFTDRKFISGESDIPLTVMNEHKDPSVSNTQIEFVQGRSKRALLIRKLGLFAGSSSAITHVATNCFEIRNSYKDIFHKYFGKGESERFGHGYPYVCINPPKCQTDDWQPSNMLTIFLSSIWILPLSASFYYAYRFGVTKEKKYLAFALATLAIALGLSLTDQMLNELPQLAWAKADGYNWACLSRPDEDYQPVLDYLNGKPTVINNVFTSVYAKVFALMLSLLAVFFGAKWGAESRPRLELEEDDQNSRLVMHV